MSIKLNFEVPEGAFSAIRQDPQGFIKELRLAAAVKWYEMGMISQEKAAEIAGLTREAFIFSLGRFNVSPCQYSVDEIKKEITHG